MKKVERISRVALENLFSGKYSLDKPVVVKFYGNSCHLCHALKPIYESISNDNKDFHFYAFNMEDGDGLEEKYGFSGVPTIFKITSRQKPIQMPEPKNPDKNTWYSKEDIIKFIKE